MKLHCISCFFNPCSYKTPVENCKLFLQRMCAQGIPTTLIELSFSSEFQIGDGPGYTILRDFSNTILFQQKKLLNYLINYQLPDNCDGVVWIDSDIFLRDGWFEKVAKSLETYDITQPFRWLYRLHPADKNLSFEQMLNRSHNMYCSPSAAHNLCKGVRAYDATGFVWAARREFLLKCGGLFDRSIVGGDDTIMINAWFNNSQFSISEKMNEYVREYTEKVKRLSPKIDACGGEAFHLYHGSPANRQYINRYEILTKNEYNPYEDVIDNGVSLEWSSDKPDFHNAVRQYFLSRLEDSA